uniref:Uncharacterized protein n=1 Tax=Melanopsichium pennsylvanicum 4 TaxID=1398559 RepID=A0A077R550_9BASI|nr:uncharacterized protein BN887_06147 [Melanopsichium pennsylvanicum 4]
MIRVIGSDGVQFFTGIANKVLSPKFDKERSTDIPNVLVAWATIFPNAACRLFHNLADSLHPQRELALGAPEPLATILALARDRRPAALPTVRNDTLDGVQWAPFDLARSRSIQSLPKSIHSSTLPSRIAEAPFFRNQGWDPQAPRSDIC